MRRYKGILWTSGLLALAVVLTVPALAQPRHGREAPPKGEALGRERGPRPNLAEHLGLSEEQRDRMRDLRRETMREAMVRHGEMASVRSRLEAEFMKDNLDAAAIRALGEDLRRLTGEGMKARLEHRLSLLEVLTPEQREKLMDARIARHHQGRHRGFRDLPGIPRGYMPGTGSLLFPGMSGDLLAEEDALFLPPVAEDDLEE